MTRKRFSIEEEDNHRCGNSGNDASPNGNRRRINRGNSDPSHWQRQAKKCHAKETQAKAKQRMVDIVSDHFFTLSAQRFYSGSIKASLVNQTDTLL